MMRVRHPQTAPISSQVLNARLTASMSIMFIHLFVSYRDDGAARRTPRALHDGWATRGGRWRGWLPHYRRWRISGLGVKYAWQVLWIHELEFRHVPVRPVGKDNHVYFVQWCGSQSQLWYLSVESSSGVAAAANAWNRYHIPNSWTLRVWRWERHRLAERGSVYMWVKVWP